MVSFNAQKGCKKLGSYLEAQEEETSEEPVE